MSMLSYGAYDHDPREVSLAVSQQAVYGQTRQKIYHKIRWHVRGVKRGVDRTELQTKLTAMELAYASDGEDLSLSDSHHALSDASTINGIRIVGGINYHDRGPGGGRTWGPRIENLFVRTYSIIAEAEVLDVDEEIVHWHESLLQIGTGGPDFVIKEAFGGAAQFQGLAQITKYRLIQQGYAIGATAEPAPPSPLYPAFLKPRPYTAQISTPQLWGLNTNLLFPARWEYHFESAGALTGTPTIF